MPSGWVTSLLCSTFLFSIAYSASRSVISTNFGDPSLLEYNGTWYAYATANGNPPGINVQVATSQDFSNWTLHTGHDAMPTVGRWARQGNNSQVWAPDVHRRADGMFVLYYSALHNTSLSAPRHMKGRKHCIGAAVGAHPQGPFTPLNETIACDLARGGAIDPSLFHDPATNLSHLVYKVDGNSIGSGGACGNSNRRPKPTPLKSQLLKSTDLTTPEHSPVQLLANGPQDGPNIEGPVMFYHDGIYYLVYNNGCYVDPSYALWYAACKGAKHVRDCKWTSIKKELLLKSGMMPVDVQAPGGFDVSSDGSKMIFMADTYTPWFKVTGVTSGRGKRDRAMFAAELLYDVNGDLSIGQMF